MATTENTFTGNGSTTNYSFTFPYIKTTDVKASINGTDITAFTLANATTVQFNTAPANSAAIRIYRATDDSALPATFYAGSSIKSSDLNDNFLQNLYTNQETNNNVWTTGTKTIDSSETWVGNNTKVATTGAIDGRVDAKIDTALGSDVLVGTDLIKTVSGGQVTVAHNVNGANSTVNNSNGNVIQDITISAQGHVTSVASTNLDGRYYTETETGSLIDSKIDTAVTTDILAGQSITKTNGSGQVTISIANGAIGTNQIADDAVDSSKLANDSVDSEHYVDGSIGTAHIANTSITTSKIAADAVDGTKLADNAVGAEHISANSVGDSEIATGALDNRYYTETELNAGQLDNRYYTETELNAGQLDNRYYTETESDARYFNVSTGDTIKDGDTFPDNDTTIATTAAINDRIVDLVDDVGGFVPIANETSFPNANPDVNNGTGTLISIKALSSNLTSNGSGVATIANGTVGNSTVTITGLANSTTYSSGYGMIVETTTTLNTYTFHRQVPIATEVTTVASNISNINSVANNSSNINSAVSNASNINSAVSNASNINSVAGNISNVNTVAGNNTNINTVAGANSNISTVATNITNVNNVGGSIANVNTVAGNLSGVNSFGERYRVASSAPGSGNDEGDLYFDTTANELKVYNGSAWQGGVTASGNFASTTGNTFTGSNTYQDNVKAQFGTGDDLKIWHNGNNSFIEDQGTGNLYISSADQLFLRRYATNDTFIKCIGDGSVELYYDNAKKLETTSTGAQVTGGFITLDSGANGIHSRCSNTQSTDTNKAFKIRNNSDTDTFSISYRGNVYLPDSNKINFGTGNDLQIFHDGSHSRIKDLGTGSLIFSSNLLKINNAGNTEVQAQFIEDGAVELYYDGSKKLETSSAGAQVTGNLVVDHSTNNQITINAGDGAIELCRSGAAAYIDFKNSTGEDYDLRLQEAGGGLNVTGNVSLPDSKQFIAGSSSDLQIYHDGTDSWIENTTGELILRSSVGRVRFRTNDFLIKNNTNTENYIYAVQNGAVDLYYDAVKKFETKSGGTKTTGTYHLISNPGGTAYLEVGQGATDNQYAHLDLVGDTTYNNYGFRILRGNTGANTTSNIYHRGTGAFNIICQDSAELRFLTNNSTRWRIEAGGDLRNASDSYKLKLGAGDDLQMYHNGSNSYITHAGAGNLCIYADGGTDEDIILKAKDAIFLQPADGEAGINVAANGAVELYYDNAKKLETVADGIKVTGAIDFQNNELIASYANANNIDHIWHDESANAWNFCSDTTSRAAGNSKVRCGSVTTGHITPIAGNTYDLGTSSLRWNNLYVNDMHFSNHPENPNSVDGTWGDWTLQEGENDIYMLNNRTGKKYKMALTEVS